MTDIEQKALALVNEVNAERNWASISTLIRDKLAHAEALCRAIEQHEAFRQEVSDKVSIVAKLHPTAACYISDLIIAKPDPLVEVCREIGLAPYRPDELRAAIEKRGGKIVWGEG